MPEASETDDACCWLDSAENALRRAGKQMEGGGTPSVQELLLFAQTAAMVHYQRGVDDLVRECQPFLEAMREQMQAEQPFSGAQALAD